MLVVHRQRQCGFSLVELMIGLAAGLFLLAGVVGIFAMSLQSNSINLKMTRLNQDLRSAMDLMQRELRRAGYWHLANYAASPAGNALPSATFGNITIDSVYDDGTTAVDSFSYFGAGAVDLQIISEFAAATVTDYAGPSQVSATVTDNFAATDMIREGAWMIVNPFSAAGNDVTVNGSCITYTYDRDDPTTNPTATASEKTHVSASEHFGFRLADGAVEMFSDEGTPINCAAAAASDGWYPVTSPSIVVTSLEFDNSKYKCVNLSGNSSDCSATAPSLGQLSLWIREIDITLSAELATDTTISRSLAETVRLRNDKIMIN